MIGRLHLKIVFSIVLLFGLVASQSGLAKGAHTQHTGASAKGANSVHTKPAETIDTSVTVLPPRGGFARDTLNSKASLKIVKPGNLARRSNVTAVIKPPIVRNAIGQPIVAPKNFVGSQARVSPGPAPGAGPPTGLHGAPVVAPPVLSSSPARVSAPPANLAKAANRGSVNGAALIRPATAPTAIGGAVRSNYGINGTTVQNKH